MEDLEKFKEETFKLFASDFTSNGDVCAYLYENAFIHVTGEVELFNKWCYFRQLFGPVSDAASSYEAIVYALAKMGVIESEVKR